MSRYNVEGFYRISQRNAAEAARLRKLSHVLLLGAFASEGVVDWVNLASVHVPKVFFSVPSLPLLAMAAAAEIGRRAHTSISESILEIARDVQTFDIPGNQIRDQIEQMHIDDGFPGINADQ